MSRASITAATPQRRRRCCSEHRREPDEQREVDEDEARQARERAPLGWVEEREQEGGHRVGRVDRRQLAPAGDEQDQSHEQAGELEHVGEGLDGDAARHVARAQDLARSVNDEPADPADSLHSAVPSGRPRSGEPSTPVSLDDAEAPGIAEDPPQIGHVQGEATRDEEQIGEGPERRAAGLHLGAGRPSRQTEGQRVPLLPPHHGQRQQERETTAARQRRQQTSHAGPEASYRGARRRSTRSPARERAIRCTRPETRAPSGRAR